MKNLVKNIIYSVKNLLKYRKIIWYDRDWDSIYLLELMAFKLKNMIIHFEKDKIAEYVDIEKDIKNMKKALYSLNRLIKDEYELPEYKEYIKYWNHDIFDFDEPLQFLTFDTKKDYNLTKKQMEYEKYMKKQDIEFFSKIFSKHWEKWWN